MYRVDSATNDSISKYVENKHYWSLICHPVHWMLKCCWWNIEQWKIGELKSLGNHTEMLIVRGQCRPSNYLSCCHSWTFH